MRCNIFCVINFRFKYIIPTSCAGVVSESFPHNYHVLIIFFENANLRGILDYHKSVPTSGSWIPMGCKKESYNKWSNLLELLKSIRKNAREKRF